MISQTVKVVLLYVITGAVIVWIASKLFE